MEGEPDIRVHVEYRVSIRHSGGAPRLDQPKPRAIRPRWDYRVQRGFLTILPLVLVALAGWAMTNRLRTARELLDHGVITQGKVTDRHAYHGKNTTYEISYAFADRGGQPHALVQHTDRETFRDAIPGSPLTLTYLPEQPDVAKPFVVDAPYVAMVEQERFWVVVILGLLAATTTLFSERDLARHRRLGRHGEPVIAQVVERQKTNGSKTNAWDYLTYTFADAGGLQYRQKAMVAAPTWANHPEGSELPVLYDPEHPAVSLPLANLKVTIV